MAWRQQRTHDLCNDFGGGVDVDDTLVDAHLEAIPGVGTLSAGGLAGGDAEDLGGHAGGSLDLDTLILSSTDEISADYSHIRKHTIIRHRNHTAKVVRFGR